MLMLYPGALNVTKKCFAGEGGKNVEVQDIFVSLCVSVSIRLGKSPCVYCELLQLVLIIVYHPWWF